MNKKTAIALADKGAGSDWIAQADTALRYWCKLKRGGPFTAWQVVEWANRKWPQLAEKDGRAWGGRFQSAARAGRIAHAGHSVSPNRHGSVCNLWRVV